MAFVPLTRTDDDWQWTWDDSTSSKKTVITDSFQLVFPNRLARGYPAGRQGSRASNGIRWTIGSGQTWTDGALLRLNDPDNNDNTLVELTSTTSQSAIAVAIEAVSSGVRSSAPEFDSYLGSPMPQIVNILSVMRFIVTDVNGVTPASVHIDTTASLDNTGNEWTIDVTGSGAVNIVDIFTDSEEGRAFFIVQFRDSFIQDNPND